MKLSIFFVAIIAGFVLSADALTLKPKCYKKVVSCCFKYAACGYVPKALPSSYGCDFKKCDKKCNKVCKPVCKDVKKAYPKKTCVPAYKQVCTKSYDYYGKEKSTCKQVANGQSCKTTNTYKTEKACSPYCENKCADVCYTVKATCSKTKNVKYEKWCPKLTCGKEAVEGSAGKPGDQVDTKAIFVSESKPVRKVIGKY